MSVGADHEVNIRAAARIGYGPELLPGTYQLEVVRNPGATEVSFFQQNDFVASVPATLCREGSWCARTEISWEHVDGAAVITRIWLKGSRESLVFAAGDSENPGGAYGECADSRQ